MRFDQTILVFDRRRRISLLFGEFLYSAEVCGRLGSDSDCLFDNKKCPPRITANQLFGLSVNKELGNIDQWQVLIVNSLSMMHSISQITPSYPSKIYTPS
jgi:hypothetical protein